ncbi:Wzz/FepE/Etk N-terminal domain-containing protein [Gammaproteobacteria bacterium]|nr:Wzz/FepE/Etk N-terminal domain-containing protein [Gammaproteobacteria bacterium]
MEENKRNIASNEIDILEIFHILWKGKFKIVSLTLLFAIGSIYYALSIPNQYTATAVFSPSKSSNSSLSSSMGQLGGLASLTGVNLGNGEASDSMIALEIMQSWSFIEKFISKNNLSIDLHAAKGWDKKTNELVINNDIYNINTNKWVEAPPRSWNLFQSFSGMLNVSNNRDTGLITISIEYFSPYIAKEWLDLFVQEINSYMQKREMNDVNRNLEYLNNEIDGIVNAEMRQVFYTLIKEQEKNKMLVSANPEYALKSVNPSMIPDEKSQPRRSIICIGITLFGLFFSVLLVLVMHYSRRIV